MSTIFTSFTGISKPIWWLALVSLINRIGTMIVSFMTLYLTQALHFDIATAGYVLFCYGLGCILGHYLGGQLTDKFGFHPVMWLALLFNGIVLLSIIYVHDFWACCVAFFLLAAASEAFRPANTVAIKSFSDTATRTRSYSLLRVSVNMAIGIALIGGGALVSLGWEWLFWVDALTCFGAVLIVWFFLKNPPNTPPQYLSEKTPILVGNDPPTDNKAFELSAYRNRKFLFFTFMTFIGAVVFMQLAWTVPVFFKEIYGWSEFKIGVFAAINTAIVMLVEMPLIYRIEKKRPPMTFVQFGIFLYGFSYLVFLLPDSWAVALAIVYMIIISFGEIFVMPFSTTWATHQGGAARSGQYMALYGMAYAVTNAIAPFFGTQVIAHFGYSTLWLLMAGLSIVAWLGFGYLNTKE
jgi:predicted MFS family arabinose efflux permease